MPLCISSLPTAFGVFLHVFKIGNREAEFVPRFYCVDVFSTGYFVYCGGEISGLSRIHLVVSPTHTVSYLLFFLRFIQKPKAA